ncbi:fluoride efflux transporter FluC [Secundilactobacillus kimchicus]|uniref:fluoride efflux transporter FluC n=1 Tax=Secundilactobacillus kimchicus TaxID=528209 RepID=UPI0006D20CF5|nr:CrcB family protein [Secundilactobacillus kimchicus]
MVMNVIVMSLAGTVGAVLRYGVTRAGNVLFKTVRLPVATLVINLVGAFCLGLAVSHLNSASLSWQLSSGFLAGFTTFSTFTNEVVTLHKKTPLNRLRVLCFIIWVRGGGGRRWADRLRKTPVRVRPH